MKKILCIVLAVMLLLAALPALAAGEITVTVNGEKIYFDQPPVVQNGRTLVPIRGVFEALGCTVSWNGANQQITIKNGDEEIVCWLSSDRYEKRRNGVLEREGQFDVVPQAMNGRTLVPVRAISEAFDCDVEWNGDTSTVVINDADTIKIGVLQKNDLPDYDAVYYGFVDAVQDSGLKVYFERQMTGISDIGSSIVANYVDDGKDLILDIDTLTTISKSTDTEGIPVLYTAVTTPTSASEIISADSNISGTIDKTFSSEHNVTEQIDLLCQVVPEIQSVGLVYYVGDNIGYVPEGIDEAETILNSMGVSTIHKPLMHSIQAEQAISSCVGQVQALYYYGLPSYAVADAAITAKLPLICCHADVVEFGGLITCVTNYYNLGYKTGQMAVRYLTGEVASMGDMPVEQLSADELNIVVNWETASALGITPEMLGLYVPGM